MQTNNRNSEYDDMDEEGDCEEENMASSSNGQVYIEIDQLVQEGCDQKDINKLKENGFLTVMSLLQARHKDLVQLKGIAEAKLDNILKAARNVQNVSWITGQELVERRKNIFQITTGSSNVDKLLKGGIESQSITEVYGEYRCGKTQLCLTLCVTAQMDRDMGGGCGKVAFIDTENTFRPDRINSICQRFNMDTEEVLSNILYARALTTEHQTQLLQNIVPMMFNDRFSLLIVDSIMGLFRTEFAGRGELSDRQQKLGIFLSILMKIAEQFNVAVFITNQVMSDPSGTMLGGGDQKKPIGGNILAHASTTRLQVKKGSENARKIKIIDSPCLADGEADFKVTEGGVSD